MYFLKVVNFCEKTENFAVYLPMHNLNTLAKDRILYIVCFLTSGANIVSYVGLY